MLSLTNHSLAEKVLKTANKGRFFQKRKSHLARAPNLSLLHSVTNATKSACKKKSYLVLSIFRNCKISENCISLRALKNLKPAVRENKVIIKNNSNCKSISQ